MSPGQPKISFKSQPARVAYCTLLVHISPSFDSLIHVLHLDAITALPPPLATPATLQTRLKPSPLNMFQTWAALRFSMLTRWFPRPSHSRIGQTTSSSASSSLSFPNFYIKVDITTCAEYVKIHAIKPALSRKHNLESVHKVAKSLVVDIRRLLRLPMPRMRS
jgi:hypothetical protein